MKLTITGCFDCPACDMLDMAPGYGCNLKKRDDQGEYLYIEESKKTYTPITPEWCPLKKESIILEMRKRPVLIKQKK